MHPMTAGCTTHMRALMHPGCTTHRVVHERLDAPDDGGVHRRVRRVVVHRRQELDEALESVQLDEPNHEAETTRRGFVASSFSLGTDSAQQFFLSICCGLCLFPLGRPSQNLI